VNFVFSHNPNCSNSRKTLELLKSWDIEARIIEYQNSRPTGSNSRTSKALEIL